MSLQQKITETIPESLITLLTTIMAILAFSIFFSFIANIGDESFCIKKICTCKITHYEIAIGNFKRRQFPL